MPYDIVTPATGDIIAVTHVNQYKTPVQDLGNGAAFYRLDSGSVANQYVVDFSIGNKISALVDGQMIHLKVRATGANTGAATLQVIGPSGALTALPLVKMGGTALAAGDIQNNQMLAVLYSSQAGGRFEILNPVGLSSARAAMTASTPTTLGGSYTPINWSAADQAGGTFWVVGSPERVTIPTGLGGTYAITGQVDFTTVAATTGFAIQLTVNGTRKAIHRITVPPTALNTTISVSAMLPLVTGDYVRFEVARSSGTDHVVADTLMRINRIGP